jgi:hypothetical protein
MKPRRIIVLGLIVVAGVAAVALALHWRTGSQPRQPHVDPARARAESRQTAVGAEWQHPGESGAVAPQAEKISRAVGEETAVEKRGAGTQKSGDAIGDPQQSLVPLDQFRNVGRATPGATFQTIIWAVMAGNDDVLANSIAMSPADRAEGIEFLAGLPPELRTKLPTPEHLFGLLFAREALTRVSSLQILDPVPGVDAQHVTLRLRVMMPNEKPGRFAMELGPDGWRMTAPQGFIPGVKKILESDPEALTPPDAQRRRSN